ncbi:hypothetical protein [Amycolatopsis sp. 195334CR]|uniref:hypothetical protein n=1 Tax=Amycolatopsis sp. 195334CR TaxID=2814588 RepID=UPI001A8DF894|nr:hypothetical protein [Amycolatopsis sp. 195334CR]MBN6036270.1 hypothetical protein [Amycolatopsis sp. 195334CR]
MGHVADQRGEEHPGAEVEPARRAEPAPQPPADPEQLRQFQQFQQFQEFLKFSEAQKAQQAQQPGSELTQQPSSGLAPQSPLESTQPPLPQPSHQPLPQPSQQSLPQPSHQQLPQPSQQWLPAQPPQPPPPPKVAVPRWLKRFGAKLLSAFLLLIVLLIAGKLAYNHFFGTGDEDDRPAAETGGGNYQERPLLAPTPFESVRGVYDAIAQNDPTDACNLFDEKARQEFAVNMGYPDCKAAAGALNIQVEHDNDYAESIQKRSNVPIQSTMRISSCDYTVKGGPSLGAFTVKEVQHSQWLIIGHEKEPNPCPPKPSAPPSN